MNRICDFIVEKSDKKIVVISSIIFIMFMIVVLPMVSVYTKEVTGTSTSPDTNLIYTSNDLYDIAAMYGEAGRDAYIVLRFTFDVVWPIVYFMFFASLTVVLFKRTKLNEKFKYLVLLPLFGLIFDYLENISSAIVMYKYPKEAFLFANIAPYSTFLKWMFIGLSILAILVLLGIHISKRK